MEPVSATGAGEAFFAASLRQRIIGNKETVEKGEDIIAGCAGAFIALSSLKAVSESLNTEALETLCFEWKQQAYTPRLYKRNYDE